MLSVLYDRGARSSGLFRRSANYSKCQSVKMTLDAGRQTSVNFDELPLAVTAALLKVDLHLGSGRVSASTICCFV